MDNTETQEEPETYTYTLKQQFEKVKELAKGSHVMDYGDLEIGKTNTIADFLYHKREKLQVKRRTAPIEGRRIDSRNVKLEYLQTQPQTTQSVPDINAFEKELMMIN